MNQRIVWWVGLGLGIAACTQPLDPDWKLNDFRVLGVKADPAESEPGTTASLSLVTADNRVRSVTTFWFATTGSTAALANTDAGVDPDGGVLAACNPPECQIGFGPRFVVSVPTRPGSNFDLYGRSIMNVIGFACAGGEIRMGPSTDPDAGESALPFRCEGTDARGWVFSRSLYVRTPLSPNPANTNPTLQEIRFGITGATVPLLTTDPIHVPHCEAHDGGARDMDAGMCTRYRFEVAFADGSRENYQAYDAETGALRPHRERIRVGFAATAGTLAQGFRVDTADDPDSVFPNAWTPPTEAGEAVIWFYANDGRGGFFATKRTIVVD